MRYTFTDDRSRTAYPDWDAVADEQVGNLRAGLRADDPAGAELVQVLDAAGGTTFAERWAGRPAVARRSGTQRIVHPEAGRLRVAFETLQLPDDDDQRLVVYLPADEATTQALDRLAGRRPGTLRAVGD